MRKFNTQQEVLSLWYYPNLNRFTDEDGIIIHDLQEFFDVWQLDRWKRTKDYGLLEDKHGFYWELYFLEEDENAVCNHNCEICSPKCPGYSLWRDWKSEYVRKDLY